MLRSKRPKRTAAADPAASGPRRGARPHRISRTPPPRSGGSRGLRRTGAAPGAALRVRLEDILALPARRRVEALAEAPDAADLVPAVDPDDLAVTAVEAGLDRFALIVPYASDDQIRHLFDLAVWKAERLDVDAAVEALTALATGDDDLWLRWFEIVDRSLVVALFAHLAVVGSDDAPLPGKLFERPVAAPFSIDGLYTVWPLESKHEWFLRSFLTRLFDRDQDAYFGLCAAVQYAIESEFEEDARARREGRLVEYGFERPAGAADVFAPVPPDRVVPLRTVAEVGAPAIAVPQDRALVKRPVDIPDEASFLGKCAAMLPADERRSVAAGIERVSRLVLSAEFGDAGDIVMRRDAASRTAAAISVAIDHLSGGDPPLAAAMLVERSAVDLFRVGNTLVRDIFVRAVRLRRSEWVERAQGVRAMLEPEIRGVWEAAERPRPMRWSGLDHEGKPRLEPFASVAQLEEARGVLDAASAVTRLMVEGLGVDRSLAALLDLRACIPSRASEVHAGDVLRTALVAGVARGVLRFDPVDADDIATFVRRATDPDAEGRRRLTASFREEATAALLARLPGPPGPEHRALASYIAAALDALEAEIGFIDPEARIDVRFVGGMVRRAPAKAGEVPLIESSGDDA